MRIKNNSGSTLIMVIIIIGFISILSSILLTMTGNAVRMKNTNKASKSNFYSAETVLSEIRTGLEGVVSEAIEKAFVEVLTNYLDDSVDKKEVFADKFTRNIFEALKDDADSNKYDIEKIRLYIKTDALKSTLISSSDNILKVDDTNPDKPAYVILKNIKISYVDSKNYKTTLSTDIKFDVPEVVFNSTTSGYNAFSDYGLIADIDIITNGGTPEIKGSVYSGENIKLNSLSNLSINKAKNIIALENIEVIDASELYIKDKANVWAKNMVTSIASSTDTSKNTIINIDGNSYINNDLLLNARMSDVTIKGDYYGYGNEGYATASNSSAIIINGLSSKLDISELDKLLIAGRAYIDPNTAGNSIDTGTDIKTGESLAVRGNQYAYLIPSEYLWKYDPSVDGGTGGDPDEGKVTFYFERPNDWGTNIKAYIYDDQPVGKEVAVWPGTAMSHVTGNIYKISINLVGYDVPKVVFNDGSGKQAPSSGGYILQTGKLYKSDGSTSDYSDGSGGGSGGTGGTPSGNPTKYVPNPVPRGLYNDKSTEGGTMVNLSEELKNYCVAGNEYTEIFYNNGGSQEVFFFFNFKDDASANKYLQKYFNDEKNNYVSNLNDTIKTFANNIVINNNLSTIISPANLITFEESVGANLKENTVSPESNSIEKFVNSINAKHNLVIKELYNTDDITGKTAYNSIVKNESITTTTSDDYEVEGYKGYIRGGNFITTDGMKGIIIASGDVTVNGRFEGLIISGKSITLNSGAKVIASSDIVDKIINAGTDFNNYLRNPVIYESAAGGVASDQVNISNLIRYERWKKNE